MAEYVKGIKEDREGILDLANLVFSQANVPHDFRELLPKVYGDRNADWMAECHYLVKENGLIKALVACPVITMEYASEAFKIGLVGTVSVHPYRRGSGYMKGFMKMMEEDMRSQGVDVLALGGRHHRYQYFGFDDAGSLLNFHLDADSIRKAWGQEKDPSITFRILEEKSPEAGFAWDLYHRRTVHVQRKLEDFVEILHSWNAQPYVILKEEQPIGYLAIHGSRMMELELTEETALGPVLYAWMELQKEKEDHWSLAVEEWETQRIAALVKDCEYYSINPTEKILVNRWERFLRACLKLKNQTSPLPETHVCIRLDQENLRIDITEGEVFVENVDSTVSPDFCLEGLNAIRTVFGPAMSVAKALNPLPQLFPLPFCLPNQDKF